MAWILSVSVAHWFTTRHVLMRVAVAEWLAGDHDQAMASILLWGRIVKNKVDLDF